MQRYILIRASQAIVALVAVSVIVFFLGRITGSPLDVLLPLEATQEDYERTAKNWGLDKPLVVQYFRFVGNTFMGKGESWKWPGNTPMSLLRDRFPATISLAGLAICLSAGIGVPLGLKSAD